jgi:hypothetical protein
MLFALLIIKNVIYASTDFCWALAAFPSSWSFTQTVELLGLGISPSQGRYLYIEQHKHTDIRASSGIRTHDHSLWAGEDSWCLEREATVIGKKNASFVTISGSCMSQSMVTR